MLRKREVTTDEVAERLAAGRSLAQGSGPWTRRFLEAADRQFGGRWHEVVLSGREALEVVLPPHAGEPCQGDRLPLVAMRGETTRAVAEHLRRIRMEYETQNPTCWSRIIASVAEPFSPLILTVAPLDAEDYRSIRAEAGRLYHLDGFHRLVGWAWAGRLTEESRLVAFLAGSPSP